MTRARGKYQERSITARWRKIVWGVTLCTFVSGCASVYRPAELPGDSRENIPADQTVILHEEDTVRVTLHSGKEFTGKFVETSSGVLTLKSQKGWGYENRKIAISEIEKIETKEETGKPSAVGVAVIVTLFVAAGAAVYYGSQLADTFPLGNSSY